MLFDSPVYFLFLALVVPLYWALKHRGQNLLLLAASYFFYGWWDYRFLGLILISTIVDFYCAKYIAESSSQRVRKLLLALSLAVNIAFLGFFKYYNFFADSLGDLMGTLGIPISPRVLSILLPPGISFYTFQAIAYIVDVYFRRIRPSSSFVNYALFISLFPHLIAGPIQRPSHLLPQVEGTRRFTASSVYDGVMLIISGLFRKCVIADNAALLANAAFGGQLGSPSIAVVLIGMYAFAWQIYGDFSGYSDIARGSAQLMGFHFMVNFKQPYLSESLQDFWRRWHISLSTWLRDYLYIPLGGNRHGEGRTQRNLLLTMLIGGFWHGANWTYIVWGGLHGFGLALARAVRRAFGMESEQERTGQRNSFLSRWWKRVLIFHFVCFTWVFFRASDVSSALQFLSGMLHWNWAPEYATAALFLALVTLPLFAMDVLLEKRQEEYAFERTSPQARLIVACVAVLALVLFSGNSAGAFIYFQF